MPISLTWTELHDFPSIAETTYQTDKFIFNAKITKNLHTDYYILIGNVNTGEQSYNFGSTHLDLDDAKNAAHLKLISYNSEL